MTNLENPRFTTVRWREGYAFGDVDDFLADVRPLLDGPLPNNALADRIETVRFSPVRLRPGYDMDEVDQHLEQLFTLASQGRPSA